jgi:hypothetical protein
VSRSHWAHHNQSIKKEPHEKCIVTGLQFSDRAPHRNGMDVGAHEEDRSADAYHNRLNPFKNAWLQHFDSLIRHPIEILWLWAPTKKIVVLEPITNAWLR